MSARALAWAWEREPRTSGQKLVLAALADRADEDGECFPSIEWISSKCAPMSEQSVKRALRELAEQGLIEKSQRRRRSDGTLGTWIYRLPVVTDDLWSPEVTSDPADSHQDKDSSVEADASTALALIDEKPEVTTQTLVAEIVDEARALDIPLPRRVTGQLAKYVKDLSDEGYSFDVIRAGVARMMERRVVQPALLANFVTEAALAARPATNGRRYGRGVRHDELEAVAQRLEREGR